MKLTWQSSIAILGVGCLVYYAIDLSNEGTTDDLMAPVQSVIDEIEGFFSGSSSPTYSDSTGSYTVNADGSASVTTNQYGDMGTLSAGVVSGLEQWIDAGFTVLDSMIQIGQGNVTPGRINGQ